ncbi:hypothetical protein OF83DRAFT_320630 [Amylostereum chailletii]|nr:hypothetical protein OF83DRAFT_320630 [Amylostereum chailletii]
MLHKRPAVRRIDDFRNGATTSSPTTTPSLSSIKVFCRGMTTAAFRELLPAKPAPLMIDDADCIFIAGGLSRILFLTPTHRFAPSNGPGGVSSSWSWKEAKSLFDIESVRNVILSARSGYKYLGSYRCTLRHDLSSKEISDLRGQLVRRLHRSSSDGINDYELI